MILVWSGRGYVVPASTFSGSTGYGGADRSGPQGRPLLPRACLAALDCACDRRNRVLRRRPGRETKTRRSSCPANPGIPDACPSATHLLLGQGGILGDWPRSGSRLQSPPSCALSVSGVREGAEVAPALRRDARGHALCQRMSADRTGIVMQRGWRCSALHFPGRQAHRGS